MTSITHLFFTKSGVFLGDVRTQAGALAHVTLTEEGERVLGARLNEWQTDGIAVGGHVVATRDEAFLDALKAYSVAASLVIVTLPAAIHLDCWHAVMRLPLTDADRLAMIQSVISAPADLLVSWQQYLRDAAALVSKHTQKANLAFAKLHYPSYVS